MSSSEYPLHRPELYDPLIQGERKLLQSMGQTRVLFQAETLVRQGEMHDHVYRVRSGWFIRCRTLADAQRQILSIFLPGDIIGLKCMLLARQPDAVESLTAASVNLLEVDRFRKLATTDSAVALRVMFQLGEEERRLHNWVVALGRTDAQTRIAAMLLDLDRRLRRLGLVPRNSFNFPMTQQQIANYTGLTVVHVNRILRKLREAHLVTVGHGTAIIHDIDRLAEIARPALDIFESKQPAPVTASP